jgi:hypothetical protein
MRRFQQNLFHHFWSSILFSTNFQTLGMDKYNLSGKASFPLPCIYHWSFTAVQPWRWTCCSQQKKILRAAHRQAEENGEESSPERRSSLEEMASEVGVCWSSGQQQPGVECGICRGRCDESVARCCPGGGRRWRCGCFVRRRR